LAAPHALISVMKLLTTCCWRLLAAGYDGDLEFGVAAAVSVSER
jgi:hypothetical protein